MIDKKCLEKFDSHSLSVEEFVCPNTILGRRGQIPDTVIFGYVSDDDFHRKFTTGSSAKAPHYVIMLDGSVRNYVYITDGSSCYTTSLFSDSDNYYAKARGLVSCRPVNVALYSVSILFEGNSVNDDQVISAASLLRLISMKFIRIYRKKLPLDANHIISAAVLNCGYNFDVRTDDILQLCKRKPL